MRLHSVSKCSPLWVLSLHALLILCFLANPLWSQSEDNSHITDGAAVSRASEPLLRRLEAAEAEIRHLRERDEQRSDWEQSLLRRLPAIPAAHQKTDAQDDALAAIQECVCGCCGDSKPICQGVGTLCQLCKEKLSWNKGSWQIVPFGFLTGEAIGTTTGTSARAMVLRLQPNTGTNLKQEQFTVHGQTTALGLNFGGPRVGSFQLGGMILFNFLGDRPVLNQATPFFLRGYGELSNEDWRFRFGQQSDLFNPVNPVTVNFGGHKQAGNAGSFRGSLRAARFIRPSQHVQWTLEAALSQQVVNDFVVNPVVVGTDNGWPNIEGRLGVELGQASGGQRPIDVGISGVVGETRSLGLDQVVSDTWGVSLDASISGRKVGVRGEFLVGEAIGTYNAGIGQSLNPLTLDAIQTVAGWGEVWMKLAECLTFHVGYGIDDPRNEDLGRFQDLIDLDLVGLIPFAGQRARNEVYWANIMWDVSEQLDMGFEVSYRETDYMEPSVSNTGMVYHLRTRAKF